MAPITGVRTQVRTQVRTVLMHDLLGGYPTIPKWIPIEAYECRGTEEHTHRGLQHHLTIESLHPEGETHQEVEQSAWHSFIALQVLVNAGPFLRVGLIRGPSSADLVGKE